jgi:hypothetical protein
MARMLQRCQRGSRRGWGLRLLVAVAAAAWSLCGCLTPPPIEEEPQSEGAPVVDRGLVTPSETLVRVELSTDPVLIFSVAGAVTDPDGDVVYHYWYLLDEPDEVGRQPSIGTTFVLQPCRQELPFDPTDEFLMLQVDISDRPRLQDPEGEELDPLRAYPDHANVVTLEWILNLRGTCTN